MKLTMKERFENAINQPGHWSWVTANRDADGTITSMLVHSRDEDNHFSDLSEAEQEKALAWIRANIFPQVNALEQRTSYGMKHTLESRTHIYMTNNQFKEAMLLCGFYPVETDALNWWYCISKKSPIFVRQEDGRDGLLLPECVMKYNHGEWVFRNGVWQCSEYGLEGSEENCWYDFDWEPTLRQCPHCGAQMCAHLD